jgi:dTDP-4-dehydrorhamnose reductase
MIWLIGNKGMLGTEIEALLKERVAGHGPNSGVEFGDMTQFRQKLGSCTRNSDCDYIATDQEIDITDLSCLQKFAASLPLTWIINCAAYTAVDRAEDEPERAFKINADGPRNIAQVAAGQGARLIHISTDYVFDGVKDAPYLETDLPQPLGVYAVCKYQGERNIAEVLDDHFIIRSAWMYGKNGPNFVHTMLRLFREKDEVSVVADQWGSPTYAPDLAAAVMGIIAADSMAYGIYHFTNAGRINWYQFACAIYDLARKNGLLEKTIKISPISTAQYPTKARRPRYAYLSKEKICRTFSIKLDPWQDSLAAFLSRDMS